MSTERYRIRRDPTPVRPMRELDEIRRRFDEDIVRPVMRAVWERVPEEAKTWSPSIDIYEKSDFIVVKAEIPGMKQESIDISATEEILTIKGERRQDTGVKDEDYYRNEIAYGTFYRSIELPFLIDTKSIEAMYDEGILRIMLQRAAGYKPKKVSIQVKKSTT
jgi:HSP20 family protein